MFKHILLPIEGSDLSEKAARQAVKLAKSSGAALTCLTVTPRYHTVMAAGYIATEQSALKSSFDREARDRAAKILAPVKGFATREGVACEALHEVADRPYECIIATARKRKCDLILMASHGRGGLEGVLLGSETTKVLTHSKIPVLVVR